MNRLTTMFFDRVRLQITQPLSKLLNIYFCKTSLIDWVRLKNLLLQRKHEQAAL